MCDDEQQQALEWRDGVIPIAAAFDDPYFSLAGGLAETRHVFLQGNGLPDRLRAGFHVAELGFGTGLNALALAQATQHPVDFTSFEAFPLKADDIERALSAFPELATQTGALLSAVSRGETRFSLGTVTVHLVIGDARQMLPRWESRADAWFLDGFSPAKNPELWEPALMAEVARHTAPKGTFATYTAAGHVRRSLQDAGFQVERVPGFGTKRHMTRGWLS